MDYTQTPYTKTLTGLERELLSCVERLTRASEDSVVQFRALEQRSTAQMTERLDALEFCVASLLGSQVTLMTALSRFAEMPGSSADLPADFSRSFAALTEAATRLADRS